MTKYDREWTTRRRLLPETQLRAGLSKRQGYPVAFLVQLEYWHAGEWLQVARFEHDARGPDYRNVERAGLHLDIHHPDGRQVAKITDWPPLPANEAMGVADDYLHEQAEPFVRRFETWL